MAEKKALVDGWFNAYRVSDRGEDGATKPSKQFYFIASTAPVNVDRADAVPASAGKLQLTPAPTHTIVDEIVKALKKVASAGKKQANLVIAVHGFNNPLESLLENLYAEAFQAMGDPAITSAGSICIGYRWPSEPVGAPWRTLLSAAPWSLRGFLLLGPVLLALAPLIGWMWLAWLGMLFVGTAVAAFALRVIVYYRDQYRATRYGAPELLELVRELGVRLQDQGLVQNEVNLSFVAHSLGGHVVTQAVRMLSDVFTVQAVDARGVADSEGASGLANLGKAFRLSRLVLVSPDIPTEVLISTRANVLASALRRFPEAYLFSNEGDEVLRMVSTVANYFSFPTASRRYGYRLGNASVVPVAGAAGDVDDQIRVGFSTLRELGVGFEQREIEGGQAFSGQLSYFDCTYFNDGDKPTLTGGGRVSSKAIGLLEHVVILGKYLLGRFDVHGGYFQTPFLRTLIFRLAAMGSEGTEAAFRQETQQGVLALCESRQVKVWPKSESLGV